MKFFTFCLDTKSNKKVKAEYKKATFLPRHAGPQPPLPRDSPRVAVSNLIITVIHQSPLPHESFRVVIRTKTQTHSLSGFVV